MKIISRDVLRTALRAKYGKKHYRITKNNEVHIYGLMPRSNTVGWWLMGDILSAELQLGLHNDMNDINFQRFSYI